MFPNSSEQWFLFLYFMVSLFGLLALVEGITRFFKLSKEVSRKSIHILVGVLVVIFSFQTEEKNPIVFISLLFTILNALIHFFNLVPAMASKRVTYGTIYYPFTIAVLAWSLWENYFVIYLTLVLLLALADAAAALVGENLKKKKSFVVWKDVKSVEGALAMFVSSALIVFLMLHFFLPNIETLSYPIWIIAILTGAVAALSEAISNKGSDNLTVALFSGIIMYIFLEKGNPIQVQFLHASIFAIIFAITSKALKFLKLSGVISASMLAIFTYGAGAWTLALPLLAFFFSSTLLGFVGKKSKAVVEKDFEKSSERDFGQVFANGGIPFFISIAYIFFPLNALLLFYIAALSAANADTWATELGIFNKSNPRLITTFKAVEKGRSGAISFIGTLAALAGSSFVVFSGWIILRDSMDLKMVILLTLSGWLASLIDSLLGATLQVQFMDKIRGKLTEKPNDQMGNKNSIVRGLKWINNDVVNFSAILSAPLILFILLEATK